MTEPAGSVRDYFNALNKIDRSAFLSCFSPAAVARDPYGGPSFEGREGLNKFFDGMERTWEEFHMEPQAFYSGGNRYAVPWKASSLAKNGKRAEFSGVNVFTVDDDGKITELEAYWDFKDMLSQIRG